MVELLVNSKAFTIEEKRQVDNLLQLSVNGKDLSLEIIPLSGSDASTLLVRVGTRLFLCRQKQNGRFVRVWVNDRPFDVEFASPKRIPDRAVSVIAEGPISVEAPMAGRIIEIMASPGKKMEEGQPLLVLEAMKMENEILAPKGGVVKEVHIKVGSLVRPGDRLVSLD